MKICPVCNDSFADQLNFCDIDGAPLRRMGISHERNKWWSLLGAGLLVGALVITAASILFMPKARVASPVVTSEPQSTPGASKEASAENPATVAAVPEVNAEPEPVPSVVPESKKKDRALDDESLTRTAPNPKAAALAAEEADKKLTPIEVKEDAPASSKPEASPSETSTGDKRSVEPADKPPDLKKEGKTSPQVAKESDKKNDKKKDDEKDKKKGGFLRVFKKIFGKD